MLIAEDLLLLLTDDATGKLRWPGEEVDLALAGATLVELALMGRIRLDEDEREHRHARVVVVDSPPAGDAFLDAALERLGAGPPMKPNAAVRSLSKNARERLYERLAASGVLRSETARILGVLRRQTWPAADSSHEADLHGAIKAALVSASQPDAHTGALIALLHALDAVEDVVDLHGSGLTRADVRARVDGIATGSWAAEAVRKCIDAMLAAIVAGTTAAVSTVVLPGAG